MEKAKIIPVAELAQLPWGGVAWRESHTVFDCGKYGKVDGYRVYPMLVSVPGEKGMLCCIDEEGECELKINNIPRNSYFWDALPDPEQIKTGIPIDDALKIFNKYENEKYGKV